MTKARMEEEIARYRSAQYRRRVLWSIVAGAMIGLTSAVAIINVLIIAKVM